MPTPTPSSPSGGATMELWGGTNPTLCPRSWGWLDLPPHFPGFGCPLRLCPPISQVTGMPQRSRAASFLPTALGAAWCGSTLGSQPGPSAPQLRATGSPQFRLGPRVGGPHRPPGRARCSWGTCRSGRWVSSARPKSPGPGDRVLGCPEHPPAEVGGLLLGAWMLRCGGSPQPEAAAAHTEGLRWGVGGLEDAGASGGSGLGP